MRWLGISVLCLMLAACGTETTGGQKNPSTPKDDSDDDDDKDTGEKTDAGGKKLDGGKADAGRDASGGKTDGKTSTSELVLPAPVCKILQENACLTCHRTPLDNGAPMPLFDVSHFTADSDTEGTIADQVIARIEDAQRPMPPINSGRPMLKAEDVETLKGWISGGMRGTEGEECDPFVEPDVSVDLGVPDWAKQPWPEDCEAVFTLGAHGDRNPLSANSSAYDIPTSKTDYHCFYEKVPWPKEMHAVALRVRQETDDDKEFVHHLVVSAQQPLLDNSLAGAKPDFPGDHKHCDNPTGSTLAVWAPGAQNPISTPTDTSILLPNSDAWFEMQVHYNNPKGKIGHKSKLRYDICATSKPREQVAGTFWLGYENAGPQTISGLEMALPLDNKGNGKATGVCEAKNKGRILSIMPHMHEVGKHAKVELIRKAGGTLTLIDTAFNFEDQYSAFFKEVWVEQGDKVVTTCEWSKSPVYFGFASDMEMCFFYTLAYPLSTFAANPLFGERGIVGGNLACAAGIGP
jgi:hypothetical protein